VKLAVLSNKPDPTVKQIVEGFFPGIFDIALGGREGVPLKPDPTAALDIISELGFAPDECAWVGDTSTDIETGKNLGARVSVGVLWGFRKRDELVGAGADVVISSASGLTEALGIG
jgi:phosphoglycolate phosphatase